jgi:DNA-binding transcriptional regulator YdaS (Cro superfamily)
MDALLRAIKIAGGVTKLANALGCEQHTVSMWLIRKSVPPVRAIAIEHVTGGRVKKSELCPLFAESPKTKPARRKPADKRAAA